MMIRSEIDDDDDNDNHRHHYYVICQWRNEIREFAFN